jgi:FkbM family methyltransferase
MPDFDISTLFVPEKTLLAHLRLKGYRPKVIFDVGASTGVWSECIASVAPDASYFLFEPLADIVDEYRAGLQNRLLRFPEWRLYRVALGEHDGTSKMLVTRDGYSSSFLASAPVLGQIAKVSTAVEVPVRLLDGLIRQYALPQPSLIKMDCQGYEACIIRGAPQAVRNADLLFLETWIERGYGPDTPLLSEITAMVGEMGFQLVGYGEHFHAPTEELYAVDAFYASPRLVPCCKDSQGYQTGMPELSHNAASITGPTPGPRPG